MPNDTQKVESKLDFNYLMSIVNKDDDRKATLDNDDNDDEQLPERELTAYYGVK